MTALHVTMNLDLDPWKDLLGVEQNAGTMATIDRIGLLPQGMQSGRASVAIAITLPDGQVYMAEASWANFKMAFTALAASPVAQMEAW